MSFDMSSYIDVAERIDEFVAKYPGGSLQSELSEVRNAEGELVGWACKAYAYRTFDDPRPGIGHAVEPVPGKTPYTKDSEAMNAETSAWGRAIVALGFHTKKIASVQEVRNRSNGEPLTDLPSIPENAKPSEYVVHFGKNRGTLLGSLTKAQLSWYAEKWEVQEDPSDYDRRLKAAAVSLNAGEDVPMSAVPADLSDVPFA